MPRQDHTPITSDQLDEFLEGLAEGKSVQEAAGSQAFRRKLYRLRKTDAELDAAWRAAYDEGTDALEKEAQRRAVEGVEDVKMIGKGEFQREVKFRQYSDTLLIFLLKARRPEKYRDNVKVEHGGPDGQPVQMEVKHTVDDLAAVASILAGAGVLSPPAGTDS